MQKAKDLVTWWSNFLSFFSLKAIGKFITDVKQKFPFSRRTYKVKNKFHHLCMVSSWFITFLNWWLLPKFTLFHHQSISLLFLFLTIIIVITRKPFFSCYQGGCQTLHVQGANAWRKDTRFSHLQLFFSGKKHIENKCLKKNTSKTVVTFHVVKTMS